MSLGFRHLAIALGLAVLAVAVWGKGGLAEPLARTGDARPPVHHTSTRHTAFYRAPAAHVRAAIARYPSAAVQQLAIHLADHTWATAGPVHKLPARQRLRVYRMMAGHGLYVWQHSPHKAPYARKHLRQYRHAMAHVRKINRLLRPVYGVPPRGFHYPWWWVPLGRCETGSNPPNAAYNGPDGYDGWINFLPSTWDYYKVRVAGASQYKYAYKAPEYVQYLVTLAMHRDVPWSQSNPACSAQIGLS